MQIANDSKLKYFPQYQNIKSKVIGSRSLRPFAVSQPAIACSKLTIETVEQGVKYVQS